MAIVPAGIMRGVRKMRNFVCALAIGATVGLAGCQTGPGTATDVHTGKSVVYSSIQSPYTGLFDFMQARAAYSNKGGYGVSVSYSAYGWAHLREAWSYGTQFPFERGPSDISMCGGAGGCITTETGRIGMTESQFRKAAKDGFTFELVGTTGKAVGKMKAKPFQEVLERMGK